MATVDFIIDNSHDIIADPNLADFVKASPAVIHAGRLYVIYSRDHTFPVYIGTSSEVHNRFADRIRILNEFGLKEDAFTANASIFFFTIRIMVDGTSYQPNDLGDAHGIDVEHLLIRLYLQYYRMSVRNVAKVGQFNDALHTPITVNYTDPHKMVGGFSAINGLPIPNPY